LDLFYKNAKNTKFTKENIFWGLFDSSYNKIDKYILLKALTRITFLILVILHMIRAILQAEGFARYYLMFVFIWSTVFAYIWIELIFVSIKKYINNSILGIFPIVIIVVAISAMIISLIIF